MKNIFTFEKRLYRYTELEDLNFCRHLTDCEIEEFKFLFRYFHDQKFKDIEDNKQEENMITTIDYKGKCILFLDHAGKGDKDLVNDLVAGNVAIEQASKTGDVYVLANFSGAYLSEAAMDYLKSDESKRINAKIKKTAVIGIAGVKKILLNVYNKFMQNSIKVFDDFESAKEYLAS